MRLGWKMRLLEDLVASRKGQLGVGDQLLLLRMADISGWQLLKSKIFLIFNALFYFSKIFKFHLRSPRDHRLEGSDPLSPAVAPVHHVPGEGRVVELVPLMTPIGDPTIVREALVVVVVMLEPESIFFVELKAFEVFFRNLTWRLPSTLTSSPGSVAWPQPSSPSLARSGRYRCPLWRCWQT